MFGQKNSKEKKIVKENNFFMFNFIINFLKKD